MAYSGLLPLLLIAAAAPLASAIEITVGDDLGWTDYTCYRPITNVRVGDTLFFKATGAHDVFKMTSEENLDACDFMGGERIARAGSDAEYIVNEEDAAAFARLAARLAAVRGRASKYPAALATA